MQEILAVRHIPGDPGGEVQQTSAVFTVDAADGLRVAAARLDEKLGLGLPAGQLGRGVWGHS